MWLLPLWFHDREGVAMSAVCILWSLEEQEAACSPLHGQDRWPSAPPPPHHQCMGLRALEDLNQVLALSLGLEATHPKPVSRVFLLSY